MCFVRCFRNTVFEDMRESDWKRFRELRTVALDRFCERALHEVSGVAQQRERTAHEKYLAVYALVRKKDKELAELFDNPRRSTALWQLALIHRSGLLTDEEFSHFSAETREVITRHPRA